MEEILERTNYKDKKMLNRREALSKASCLTLSVATMMILMKSQPAMAASTDTVHTSSAKSDVSGVAWQRTSK